jgi:hypothetical protein
MLNAEQLSLVRGLAQRSPKCCDDEMADPCDRFLVLRAVEDLVLEIERHRTGLPPEPLRLVPSEAHEALVAAAKELVERLTPHVPLPTAAHVARSHVAELLDEIEGARPMTVSVPETGTPGARG